MDKNKLVSLKQIHEEYDVSVWDNCALVGYLHRKGKRRVNDDRKFAEFLLDNFSEYNCFIPEKVKEEYLGVRYGLKLREELISKFKEEDRVLCVDDFPLGMRVKGSDKYADKLEKKYNLHTTDLRVVSWRIALSYFFGSAAIISNDIKGVGNFWKGLIKKNETDSKKFGFFPRRGLDLYEKFVAR
jgi:hypothetical protein